MLALHANLSNHHSELNIDFYVGKVKSNDQILPVDMWDMTCPKDILALENQAVLSSCTVWAVFYNS